MDPDIANFAVVAVIIVVMAASFAAITRWFVRGVQKQSAPRGVPNLPQFEQLLTSRKA